jgi:hypothetical protein
MTTATHKSAVAADGAAPEASKKPIVSYLGPEFSYSYQVGARFGVNTGSQLP